MASRLRISRADPSGYVAPSGDGGPSADLHQRLQAVIRRHLPAVNASLLAAPSPTTDGHYVEWYSDLSGQPRKLTALPEAEQARARALLEDRLNALQGFAERLPVVDPGAGGLAESLRQALSYPGDDTVYVIGDQPVITFWGYRSASGPAPSGPSVLAAVAAAGDNAPPGVPPPAAAETTEGRRLPRWLWLLALFLVLALLAYAAWWYSVDFRWPPWIDYKALIAAAENDERALRDRIAALEAEVARELEKCRLNDRLAAAVEDETALRELIEALNARVVQELALCPLHKKLEDARADGAALGAEAAALGEKIAAELEECRRKAEDERRKDEEKRRGADEQKRNAQTALSGKAEPPSENGPPKKEKAELQPCPGERAPEEAPDLAIVLDSSGSMRAPASSDRRAAQQMAQQMMQQLLRGLFHLPGGGMPQNQGPTRLQAAQKASTKVVRELPSDVDVGLVVLENCPRASNLGFYPGSRRSQLYQRINSLQPRNGTPLADGVEQAGQMVDGVGAPAVIVVVSDGEDSCHRDPCAVARSLKARKPRLTINVVDIVGDGYANCLAQRTGGKILTPKSGLAFESTIKQATGEAQKPAHCK